MSMKKKFLSFRRSSSNASTIADDSSVNSSGTEAAAQSLHSEDFNMNNNLADTAHSDFKSFTYSTKSNSLFSRSGYTMSTAATSSRSSGMDKDKQKAQQQGIMNIGKPLRVLDEVDLEDEKNVAENDSTAASVDLNAVMLNIDKELKVIGVEMRNTILQVNQSILNLTRASIKVSELLKKSIEKLKSNGNLAYLPPRSITTWNNTNMRKIVKMVLYLIDNLLDDEVYTHSRVLILKNFDDLLRCLKLNEHDGAVDDLMNYNANMRPKLFAVGSTTKPFPNEDHINSIMGSLFNKKQSSILDQEGSFVAPVLRGFYNNDISCVTFIFGTPHVTKEHKQIVNNVFYSLIDDFHFMLQQNQICLARTEFKAPFRIPTDMKEPPISMSISSENSTNLSGTLGGYIYPKIDHRTVKNKKLLQYENSVFGMTCAHVVLQDNITSDEEYPYVSSPSPVLINLYKRALSNERSKYRSESEEYMAYDKVIKQIDQAFPLKELKLNEKKVVKRNLCSSRFGQIIWGERIIDHARGKLSDLAIIKMEKGLKCLNYLGDDVNFNEYDPSLMFTNLYLKKVVDIATLKKSSRGLTHGGGLEVFKYGSTTKYTSGTLNGVKMIYWSDGKLKSSEFVIRSSDSKSLSFASGGDSGSWILSKIADIRQYENGSTFVDAILQRQQTQARQQTGLGVVGMLHSYDGEMKQFGLFTPMTDILERLNEVTGLPWGVIGCDEDQGIDEANLSENDETHSLSTSNSSVLDSVE